MPPPRSANKAEEQLKQQAEALKSKPKSSPQSRFPHTPSTRDAPKESKSSFSRKPGGAPDLLPKKPRSSSIAPNPPKVWPSQPTIDKPADSLKPAPQPEKKGFWNWRPFRAAAPAPSVNIPQRFHVLYSLHVHSIQNLPAPLNGLRLIVHWNRKEEGLQTMPSRVLGGVAEFDEMLRQRCTVEGTRSSNKLMQYEPKLFTISVVALDVDELELGKHHIDLSRLLPEEGDAGQGSHSWSTNFELSGMAKGSSLFVSFNYDLLHQETSEESCDAAASANKPSTQSLKNLSSNKAGDSASAIKPSTQSPTNLSSNKAGDSASANKPSTQSLTNVSSNKARDKAHKVGTVGEDTKAHKTEASRAIEEYEDKKKNFSEDWRDSQEAWDSQEELPEEAQFINDLSANLDDEVDLVAGEFLDMLDFGLSPRGSNSEGEPDSPRAKLLRQFQHDSLFGGEGDFRLDHPVAIEHSKSLGTTGERYPGGFHPTSSGDARSYESEDGLDMASIMEAAELEFPKAAKNARSKSRAQELEDEEAEALMQRWGLNETSIRDSPSKPFFGPHLNNPPPLGKGLGSILYLEDGGSLRSMNPPHFAKNKATGSLVMQSSKPVVVPSTMGANAVDILRHLASLGPETLAKQAMAAMPLEDITGKVADEVTAMGSSAPHTSRQSGNRHSTAPSFNTQSSKKGGYDDYVSLEDLAPLAMQNVEALAIDGLKVQADVAEQEAPSYLDAAAWGILGDTKKGDKDDIRVSHDVASMSFQNFQLGESKVADVKEHGPLSMALTMDEWSKLDAGIVDDDANSKEKSLALLAAHNANCQDLQLMSKVGKKGGNMGNTLMIAMLVQLRDPLKNFEPVGAPMLTLIQAERVMLPPKPRFGRNISVTGNSEVDDDAAETTAQKEEAPQFKLTGVHMSGLKSPEDEAGSSKEIEAQKKGWGTQKQLQSGSRWLAAQGMKKGSKPSLLKGKPAPSVAQTKVKPGETLWSISARVNGSGHKWKELAALNPHIRNPDVIFTNETIRTRTPFDTD